MLDVKLYFPDMIQSKKAVELSVYHRKANTFWRFNNKNVVYSSKPLMYLTIVGNKPKFNHFLRSKNINPAIILLPQSYVHFIFDKILEYFKVMGEQVRAIQT